MPDPTPSDAQRAFYRDHGWLQVDDAFDTATLTDLVERTRCVREAPAEFAFDPSTLDPSTLAGAPRPDPVLISNLDMVWIGWRSAGFHAWTASFAAGLVGRALDFWYDQIMFKPPRVGAATHWHQDEAYLGPVSEDLMISAWLALEDVGADEGPMEFVEGGHRQGLLDELRPTRSSAPRWEPDPKRVVACPLRAGSMTFHHGKTPHRAGPNRSERWRLALIQRFTVRGVAIPTGHVA